MDGEKIYTISENVVNTIRDAARIMRQSGSENLKHYAEGVESVLAVLKEE